jgi:gamma-glutamyltranspeptidase/glutathione hydrolase
MNPIMPMAHRAMIASPHYLASTVGSFILHKGGNAFDAAIAISAALAVTYPHMTGLGGDAFFLMYDAKEKKLKGLNGSGRSGKHATSSFFLDRGLTSIPHRGVHSAITVPGMVDAWWEVWDKQGRLSWEELLEPAIQYAEKGIPISRNLAHWMSLDEGLIRQNEQLSRTYMNKGKLLAMGEVLVQPELAHSMRLVQTQGRDVFYRGELMKRIVAALEVDGGLLAEEDFAEHRSDWVEPLTTGYRGFEVCQMPPNSQGFSVLMMLNMLENIALSAVPRTSPQYYHLMVEVIKKVFHDRDRYLTDPKFVQIPMEQLLSKEYAKELMADIQLQAPQSSSFSSTPTGQDTAYAAVMDEEGNAVSFIQSLYFDFGSAYLAGSTGINMQNRGAYFSLQPDHPNSLQPGKRSFHTLTPGMVLKDNKPYALVGTQGGEGQPQTQLSILTGILDYGLNIQEAIALPRWVYGRTWGQDSDMLKMENRGLDHTASELRNWGHQVELVSGWDGVMGQAQGIMINDRGVITGAADPRGDGMAIGW